MSLAGRELAVVGGGIGGLAAATALAQRGAWVQLFEQAPELGEVGAGLQVGPNGVAVLEALGLAAAAAPHAALPEAVELRDHAGGRPVARMPLGDAGRARYGRPYWQFHRADLLAVLAEGAAAAGVELRLGIRIVGLEETGSGIRLRDADRAVHTAEIGVAADGLRSGLRVAAGLDDARARFTRHVAWRALVDAAGLPPEVREPVTRVTMGPGRHLVTYPLRAGRLINLVAVEERADWTAEGWTTPDDPDNLRRAFAGWGGAPGALLAAVESCFLWGLFDHEPLARWTTGRLALLGDACHPMLPFLAQGATMALEDAWVLAAALDRAEPAAGLGAYEAARLPRATRVQRAAARSGWLYHLRPGLRGPAQAALAAGSRLAPNLFASRFDWLFGTDVTRA